MFDFNERGTVPVGYTDTDLLQAEYERQSAEAAARKRKGICVHGWQLGFGHSYNEDSILAMRESGAFPQRETDFTPLNPDEALCLECGEIVDDMLAGRR